MTFEKWMEEVSKAMVVPDPGMSKRPAGPNDGLDQECDEDEISA